MFNVSLSGEINFEIKRIRDSYGYPDALDKTLKRFVAKIGADKMVKVGLFYKFQLRGDRKREVNLFFVYDWNDACIDESTYWDFTVLEEKIVRKLSNLALIRAWPNKIGGL